MAARKRWTAATYLELANFFGVSEVTVKRWAVRGMPKDQPYRIDHIIRWLRTEGPWRPRLGVSDPLLVGSNSPALEHYRRQRVRLTELDVADRLERLIPRERFQAGLANIVETIDRAGQTLEREHGRDARKVLGDALLDALRALEWIISTEGEVTRHA